MSGAGGRGGKLDHTIVVCLPTKHPYTSGEMEWDDIHYSGGKESRRLCYYDEISN